MFMNNADMDNFTLLAHCLFQKNSSIQTAKIVCNFMRNFARSHVRLLYMYLKHLPGLKITTCKISVNLWLSYFLRNFTETILWCLWWFSFHTNVEFTLNCLKMSFGRSGIQLYNNKVFEISILNENFFIDLMLRYMVNLKTVNSMILWIQSIHGFVYLNCF